jgi:eukaryotic-like serine/threonine-protein kinase
MPTGTAGGPLLAHRYRVIERLGTGGMAAVYLAHDERLDRDVAIKRMQTSERDDVDARRFQREAKLGASLSHPNLVSIFDTEEDDESVLLVMEYVDGETLADRLAGGPVEPRRAVQIVRAVADALDHAHSSGIVHRDIKPGNVLLHPDGAKLSDLGLAQVFTAGVTITGMGNLDSVEYVDPDVLLGQPAGPDSDVWSLGVLLHRVVAGTGVYGDLPTDDGLLALRRVLASRPRPHELLPADIGALVRDCLAPAGERPSAATVAARIDRSEVTA